MTPPFDCALNGVSLSALDDRIAVLDLQEDSPKLRQVTAPSHPDGQRTICQQRESLTIRVTFALHEPDVQQRLQLLQQVRGWAEQGSTFTASDHPGQQLTVLCTSLPGMSADDWMAPLTVVFTAGRIPYWEDAVMTQHECSGASTFNVPGTAATTPVSVMVVNDGTTTVHHLTLRCGDSHMTFNGIDLPVNGFFLLTDTGSIQTAKVGGDSVLHCRTADSSDALLASCGKPCPVEAIADQPLRIIFMARGRYA